jgi:hypothetical protein
MKICVLSRIDRLGQSGPDALHLGQRRLRVVLVLARWAEPPYHYFEVRVEDGRRFVLRHDPDSGVWELAAAYGGGTPVSRRPAAAVRL